jgi:Rieske Fe-S protein
LKFLVKIVKMGQLVLKTAKYFIFYILIAVTVSCDKVQDSQIPNVPFSFTINLNIANDLTIPGNSAFFPGGYGGVIVYCELSGQYFAFDATCTYEISQTCKIENEGVLGTCSCCESQFILIGGAFPSKGPAAAPLKQYNVSQVNSFTLRVYN